MTYVQCEQDLQVSSKFEWMTPEWASEILEYQNPNNRPVRQRSVERIAFDIMAGKWKVTHQGIAFGSNGQLLDGQHRLSAIVKAKKAVTILVTYGVSDNSMLVIDSGIARTAADGLRLKYGTRSASAAAAAIKHYFLYYRYKSVVWSNVVKPSNSELDDFYEQKRDIVDKAVDVACSANRSFKKLIKTSVSTVFLIIDKEGGDLTGYQEFMESLSKGTNLSDDSPLLAYRNFLMNMSGNSPYAQQAGIARLVQCYNYWQNDQKIKLFRPHKFPPMPEVQIS